MKQSPIMESLANRLGLKNLYVKSYSIVPSQVLGQGAFGIVYKGTDAKKNPVAAKRIDGNTHPKIHSQDYNRLLKLEHPNIIRILDIEKEGDIFWMFMPFYKLGDLNKYLRTKGVTSEVSVQIMRQVMWGIVYLHGCNIIHRDIKPGNILVESESPVTIKLTDFDVTKFLDPEIETSVMSSNVGTNAFKAPEFFLRNEKKKISYHRNVDVYAAGLTFLAMLQYDQTSPMLIPQIETPNDPSELHVPIGQLVAERIRYKVKERNILTDDDSASEVATADLLGKDVREVIRKMTCENPEDRLSAADCLTALLKIGELQFQEANTIYTNMIGTHSLTVSCRNQIFVCGFASDRHIVRVMDHSGVLIKDITSLCNENEQLKHLSHARCIVEHPTNSNCMLEACRSCESIRLYNIDTGEGKLSYTDCGPLAMGQGPGDSVLVWNRDGRVLQLQGSSAKEFLVLSEHQDARNKPRSAKCSMSYIRERNILFMLASEEFAQFIQLSDGSTLKTLENNKDLLNANAVTCDSDGRLFVCSHDSLSVINAFNGDVLQQMSLRDVGFVRDVSFTAAQPRLTLLNHKNKIIRYHVA